MSHCVAFGHKSGHLMVAIGWAYNDVISGNFGDASGPEGVECQVSCADAIHKNHRDAGFAKWCSCVCHLDF